MSKSCSWVAARVNSTYLLEMYLESTKTISSMAGTFMDDLNPTSILEYVDGYSKLEVLVTHT